MAISFNGLNVTTVVFNGTTTSQVYFNGTQVIAPAPQKEWVYITFSSSSSPFANYTFNCGFCFGISDAKNFLDNNYPATNYSNGTYAQVLDGNFTYILFQVQ